MIKITMTSEEYGEDIFEYETKRQAHAGFLRLVKSASRYFEKDGIERKITWRCEKEETRP